MPGNICISADQPPATVPLYLLVAVGKREYNGNVEEDGLSFRVTSLRESMVIMLYNADRELVAKTELKTKEIVESGTVDVVFTLDSGELILQLQFLLGDDDRKRIQEMKNSAMKRKQQELIGDGYELNFPDSPLSEGLIEKTSNIPNKGDEPVLRKSVSLDDLQERTIYSGIDVDPRMKATTDLLLQTDGKSTSEFGGSNGSKEENSKLEGRSSSSMKNMISAEFGDSNGSKKENSKLESRSSSPVNNMISAFEGSQGLTLETGASLTVLGRDKSSNRRPGKHALFQAKRSTAAGQTGGAYAYRSKIRKSSSRDGASNQNMRENDLVRSKRRSLAKHRHSIIGPYTLEQLHWMDLSRSRYLHLHSPLSYLVATTSNWLHPHVCVTTASRQMKQLLELEHFNSLSVREDVAEITSEDAPVALTTGQSQNGWLINQGVRAAIVIIACGAMFLNNI